MMYIRHVAVLHMGACMHMLHLKRVVGTCRLAKHAPVYDGIMMCCDCCIGNVPQVIDVAAGSLNNVITFPPDGAFIVDSTLDVGSDQRLNFKFTAAKLKLPNRTISLPPFGQGW